MDDWVEIDERCLSDSFTAAPLLSTENFVESKDEQNEQTTLFDEHGAKGVFDLELSRIGILQLENSLLRDDNARQAVEIGILQSSLADMDRLLLGSNQHPRDQQALGQPIDHNANLRQQRLQVRYSQLRAQGVGKTATHRARQLPKTAFRKSNHSSRFTNARKI